MKRILVLNFFPAFVPPRSGGELRYYHLYKELSIAFDVTLLSPTYSQHKEELISHSKTFREFRVPKDPLHDRLHWEIQKQGIGPEYSALVCALGSRYPNRYHDAYLRFHPAADLIIHDSPYMLGYDLFFGLDKKPRVYNSYNVESRLVNQIWSGPHAFPYKTYIRELEKGLVQRSQLVFATSPEEREAFLHTFGVEGVKVALAPNGIDPEEVPDTPKELRHGRKKALFIGSAHPPNLEAVRFILSVLSIECPDLDFFIAGSCCDRITDQDRENVRLFGPVDEATKKRLFSECDIAINPMFSGAGTNVKTLEFLAAGLPVVSTEVGARGLGLINHKHCVILEPAEFSQGLGSLFSDPERLKELSLRGRDHVRAHFSWRTIADRMASELERLERVSNKKTILVLNDYSVATPKAGGQVRIHRIYSHLSEQYNVLLLCFAAGNGILIEDITPTFREVAIPKTDEHVKEDVKRNARHPVSVTDIVNSYMCVKNELLVHSLRCARNFADGIVLSHPYLVRLVEAVEDLDVIYEAHNAEFLLKTSVLMEHPDRAEFVQRVSDLEKAAVKKGRSLVVVSEEDAKSILLHADIQREHFVIRNGVDWKGPNFVKNGNSSARELFGDHPVVVFIGSAHKPNIEALNYIVNCLALELKQVFFLIIGSVGDAVSCSAPPNVLLFGTLEEPDKNAVLRMADVGINPVVAGSGSNLKIGEYFSFRLPVVTTIFGARGFEITDGKEAIICEREEFPDRLKGLLGDRSRQASLGEQGYLYATSNLDWRVLSETYHSVIENTFAQGRRERLLVVTYRFTEPPLGGAELYLHEILKTICGIGDFKIDIATLNVAEIINQFHFGANYGPLDEERRVSLNSNFKLWRFPCDQKPKREIYQNSRHLFSLWHKEFTDLALRHVLKYDRPLLLGGWNFPEGSEESGYGIWSTGRAFIYTHGADTLTVSGSCPRRGWAILGDEQGVLIRTKIRGDFCLSVECRRSRVVELRVKPWRAAGDPRELGVFIKRMEFRLNGKEQAIPLSYCYRDFLKERYIEEYLEALIHLAQARSEEADRLFQETRGPLSRDLEVWLEDNMKHYDVVLAHSVPFRTVVIAKEAARRHAKPLAILPHFHFHDEFYHWNSYYGTMREADIVFTFPRSSVPLFFQKIGVKSCEIPGGGIHRDEFERADGRMFKQIYTSELPFLLVLGRKSGTKNYSWVIEAVAKINRLRKQVNIVLIGRDEDKRPIDPAQAIYLGEQPREIVLGALKECLALVNMSESESFGIVILEAWMFEKPVIVNERCLAFRDLVQDKVNGFLSARENLADVISLVVQEKEMAEEVGHRGREGVEGIYSWADIGKRINEVLIGLVNSRRGTQFQSESFQEAI